MNPLISIQAAGYSATLEGDNIRLRFVGEGEPDAATVRPLLDELRAWKSEAITYLQALKPAPEEPQAGLVTPLAAAPTLALVAAMQHPLYRPGLPIFEQPEPVEELWVRLTFAERGIPVPGDLYRHEAVFPYVR